VDAQEGYRDYLRDTLNPNGYHSLYITGSGDMDWYKVGPVEDIGSLAVILAGSDESGDLDLEVWGGSESSPGSQLGTSVSISANEFVMVDTSEHYWFWVRVYGYDGAEGNYHLVTAHNMAEKASENLRQTIPVGNRASLYIAGEGDEDWYRIGQVDGLGSMNIIMEGEGNTGDLDLLVFGGDAEKPTTFLGAGVSADADESVRVSVDDHYWFWVRVFPNGDAAGDYSLRSSMSKDNRHR
jgi:hypothetical protein